MNKLLMCFNFQFNFSTQLKYYNKKIVAATTLVLFTTLVCMTFIIIDGKLWVIFAPTLLLFILNGICMIVVVFMLHQQLEALFAQTETME